MKIIYAIACFGLTGLNAINYDSAELVITLASGDPLVLDVAPHDTFVDVMRQASSLAGYDESSTYWLTPFPENKATITAAKSDTISSREYHAPMTTKEKEDIFYIVTTLGKASVGKLFTETSSLEKAGNRVNHVHPFKFLAYIFKDEAMKVSILQIRDNKISKIPKKFFGGLFESLTEEAGNNNLDEFIYDFAFNLNLDASLITKQIKEKKWKELINVLIEELPRKGNPNRHNN